MTPITNYYWSTHPYKLVIDSRGWPRSPEQRRVSTANLLQKHMAEVIPEFADKRIARMGANQQKVFVYCAHIETVDCLFDLYSDRIQQLDGPVNQTHIDLLTDPHCKCTVRPHLWYHKYDLRVDITTKSNVVATLLNGAGGQPNKEAVKTLSENLSEVKVVLYNSYHSSASLYTHHTEFMQLWGLFALQHPHTVVTMERCFVNQDDKYLS